MAAPSHSQHFPPMSWLMQISINLEVTNKSRFMFKLNIYYNTFGKRNRKHHLMRPTCQLHVYLNGRQRRKKTDSESANSSATFNRTIHGLAVKIFGHYTVVLTSIGNKLFQLFLRTNYSMKRIYIVRGTLLYPSVDEQ